MTDINIYKDIATRTDGAVMIGVVGPVRTGKSTFIKRFMELAVIPSIEDEYVRERALDELPQSGSGRTIMTSEPKFVPEEAVHIKIDDNAEIAVRLVDCVGYMVKGASGQFEDGGERMVTTPWLDSEVTMSEAAEMGTSKVITEHSTIGFVITTDGSICGISRDDYIEPENRAISELKAIGKPFSILVNSRYPESETAQILKRELEEKYGVSCICTNCQMMNEAELSRIMRSVLNEFSINEISIRLPEWAESLDDDCEIKQQLYSEIIKSAESIERIRDIPQMLNTLAEAEIIEKSSLINEDFGVGAAAIELSIPKVLYFDYISNECGMEICNEGEIIRFLKEMSDIKQDYDRIKAALNDVRTKGYGVVLPSEEELQLNEPQIVKHNGHYSVKLKANAPAIHMLKTNVVTEVTPSIGGDGASEEIISFLLQGYDGDMTKLWQSNIFGRPLYEIAGEGIEEKLEALPDNARAKLQDTLQKIINDGSGMLICILL
ncbi:MAG: stage IV sporulation protein A [Bacillota bacterium]|nr:stage IV sporulation protein A [Bacillota bacterium]